MSSQELNCTEKLPAGAAEEGAGPEASGGHLPLLREQLRQPRCVSGVPSCWGLAGERDSYSTVVFDPQGQCDFWVVGGSLSTVPQCRFPWSDVSSGSSKAEFAVLW